VGTQAKSNPAQKSVLQEAHIDQRAYNYYVNGTIYETMGNYYEAAREYARALDIVPNSNEVRYSYAHALQGLKDYTGAVSNARKIFPRNADTWLLLGDSYRALGKFDSSLAAYIQAAKQDTMLVNAYYFIGAFYQQLNNLDSAIWAYQHVAELTENYQAYLQLANLQLQANQTENAKASYNRSLELDSSASNIRSYLGLSAIHEEGGDRETGKYYLILAAERAPDDQLILNRLMSFYQEDREFDKALDLAKKLWAIGPPEFGLARRMGILYYNLDSLQNADSIFSDLIGRGDNHIVNHYYAGQIAVHLDSLEKAKYHFAHLTAMADSVVDGWVNLGMVFHKQDSLQTEIQVYEKGLQSMPSPEDSLILLFSMGAALERQKEFDKAVVTFEEVLRIKPDHAPSLNYLGYMLVEKGMRLDYAEKLIKKALEIHPDNGAFIDSYGWLLYQRGKYKEALKELLRAYEFIDKDPIVLEHIGDAYQALGEKDNALKFWNLALEKDPDNQALKEKLGR